MTTPITHPMRRIPRRFAATALSLVLLSCSGRQQSAPLSTPKSAPLPSANVGAGEERTTREIPAGGDEGIVHYYRTARGDSSELEKLRIIDTLIAQGRFELLARLETDGSVSEYLGSALYGELANCGSRLYGYLESNPHSTLNARVVDEMKIAAGDVRGRITLEDVERGGGGVSIAPCRSAHDALFQRLLSMVNERKD